MATAPRTASAAEANTVISPSPSHFTSWPPCAATASLRRRWWAWKMRCARSSPTRCRSSVELTRSVKRSVTGVLMSPLSPPLGPCPRLIHLGQTRRAADRRDERLCARAYGTRPTRTLAEFLLRNNNNAGRGIALLSNVHGPDQCTEQQTSTLSCRFISISRCARTAPVQPQDEQKTKEML